MGLRRSNWRRRSAANAALGANLSAVGPSAWQHRSFGRAAAGIAAARPGPEKTGLRSKIWDGSCTWPLGLATDCRQTPDRGFTSLFGEPDDSVGSRAP